VHPQGQRRKHVPLISPTGRTSWRYMEFSRPVVLAAFALVAGLLVIGFLFVGLAITGSGPAATTSLGAILVMLGAIGVAVIGFLRAAQWSGGTNKARSPRSGERRERHNVRGSTTDHRVD